MPARGWEYLGIVASSASDLRLVGWRGCLDGEWYGSWALNQDQAMRDAASCLAALNNGRMPDCYAMQRAGQTAPATLRGSASPHDPLFVNSARTQFQLGSPEVQITFSRVARRRKPRIPKEILRTVLRRIVWHVQPSVAESYVEWRTNFAGKPIKGGWWISARAAIAEELPMAWEDCRQRVRSVVLSALNVPLRR